MKTKILISLVFVIILVGGVWFSISTGKDEALLCGEFYEGKQQEVGNTSVILTQACIEKDKVSFDVATNIVTIPLTIIGKDRKGYAYNAIVGGKDLSGGNMKVGYCLANSRETNCVAIDANQVTDKLNSDRIWVDVVRKGDERDWNGLDELADLNFFDQLTQAIISGEGFPKSGEGVNLPVSMITIYE